MMTDLGSRPFMSHHAQGFPQFAIMKVNEAEEAKSFVNTRPVPKSFLPPNANIVSSHTVYRIKAEDNDSLLLKARIISHGNEDSDTENFRSDCCIGPPLGIRVLQSTAAICRCLIV